MIVETEVRNPNPVAPPPPNFAPQRALEETAEMAIESIVRTLPVRDFSFGFKGSGVSVTKWPSGLFVPSAADYRNYWVTAPPPSNRYNEAWTSGADANTASAQTGDLWAYASLGPSQKSLRSDAAVGFVYNPAATANYRVEVTPALITSYRYDFDTIEYADGDVTISAGVFIMAWEIVDGQFNLVTSAFQSFHHEVNQGQDGISETDVAATVPFAATIPLEQGRSYLIGAVADVQLTNDWTMNNGHPMPAVLDPQSKWTLWCQIQGKILQVLVTHA